jgi:hypothetical protein
MKLLLCIFVYIFVHIYVELQIREPVDVSRGGRGKAEKRRAARNVCHPRAS